VGNDYGKSLERSKFRKTSLSWSEGGKKKKPQGKTSRKLGDGESFGGGWGGD